MNGLIAWFARNPVAANLLMLAIIVGGLLSLPTYNREIMPSMPATAIDISVVYPGADPKEVEDRVCIRIEEAIADIEGVINIESIASSGICKVSAEFADHADKQKVLNDIKANVDTIATFPRQSERPTVELVKFTSRPIQVAVMADADEKSLKEIATKISDGLSKISGVDFVDMIGVRDYEVGIEISEEALRRYNLTFAQVAQAVSGSSLNLPAGVVRTEGGDISLRTNSQAYRAVDFENITVLKNADGSNVRLADVATVIDGFTEDRVLTRFNNRPAILLDVKSVTDPDVVGVTARVREYLKNNKDALPEGVETVAWLDLSKSFKSRVSILVSGGFYGLILVFLLLLLFLRPRIAFWVCMGMFTAFMGTLWVLPMVGVSLNMISLFAFILVLGMVVDDAIIVGENIHVTREQGGIGVEAAIKGTQRVARPVLYAALTTMVAFSPILFLSGTAASVMKPLPYVVIFTLVFSLIESYFILPAHLSHMKRFDAKRNFIGRPFHAVQSRVAATLKLFIEKVYLPFLDTTLRLKFLTFSVFIAVWMVVFSFVQGGWVRQDFFPDVPADYIVADAILTDGVSFERTEEILYLVENAALSLNAYYNEHNGEQPVINVQSHAEGNTVSVLLDLIETKNRKTKIRDVAAQWRAAIGNVPDLKEFNIGYQTWMRDKPLNFVLASNSPATLEAASAELIAELQKFAGVFDLSDTLRSSHRELVIDLKPQAETLGLNTNDLANQVRQAFFGEEVQRIPRGREDVKVKVRYPYADRKSVESLQNMRVRAPDGTQVPFETVANIKFAHSPTSIRRLNRKRVVSVTGNIDRKTTDPGEVVRTVETEIVPGLQKKYPDLEFLLKGDQKEMTAFKSGLLGNLFLTLFGMYALISIAFRSYIKPLLVMFAIPFGYIGAVIGHLIYGLPWSMFSYFGVVATAGVVVNNNLVLIDYINILRERGVSVVDAVRQAAASRFRPILLTTLTTFFGLMPITFQKAPQAQYLIPMAVSLAFGVALASLVTLILIPTLYIWMEKTRTWFMGLYFPHILEREATQREAALAEYEEDNFVAVEDNTKGVVYAE